MGIGMLVQSFRIDFLYGSNRADRQIIQAIQGLLPGSNLTTEAALESHPLNGEFLRFLAYNLTQIAGIAPSPLPPHL